MPLQVLNQSGYTVKLRRAVRVERWTGKSWKPLATAAEGLLLRADCKPARRQKTFTPDSLRDGCIAIGPQATFRSEPWLGTHGHAQCACERCVKVKPGTYRYAGSLYPGYKHRLKVTGLAFRLH